MTAGKIGALIVIDGERLIGIFTERDALSKVLAGGLNPCFRSDDEGPIQYPSGDYGWRRYEIHHQAAIPTPADNALAGA